MSFASITAAPGLTVTLIAVGVGTTPGLLTVRPAVIPAGSQVFAPTVAVGAGGGGGVTSIAPAMIGPGSVVGVPVVVVAGAASIAPVTIAGGSVVRSPVVAVAGVTTIAPSSIASTAAVPAPTLTVAAPLTMAPVTIASTSLVGVPTVAVGAPTLPGFALNGSTNPALKAMLARVQAGTGRGRIVVKGDSTSAGASELTTNQRSGRVTRYLADQLTAAGYPALDNGFVGNNGALVALPDYDSRISFEGRAWTAAGGQTFSGGNYLDPGAGAGGGLLDFTLSNVTTFYADFYNVGGTVGFAVDGSVASGLTASGGSVSGNNVILPSGAGGLTRVTIPAGSAGTHTLKFVAAAGNPLARMGMGWNAGQSAIDILNHASGGANSRDQATSGSGWSNNDALGFDAPDLTIINCTLNVGNNYSDADHRAALLAMVTKAQLSGDVLMVAPHEATPGFLDLTLQAQNRLAAKEVAAAAGVAFLDLKAAFDARLGAAGYQALLDAGLFVDTEAQIVHLKTAGYSIVGDLECRAIQAMAA